MNGHLALYCDASGRLLEVLRDDLGVVRHPDRTTFLPELGTAEGSVRCFEMLTALREEQSIFGWIVELESREGPVGMHFAGVQLRGDNLLLGTRDLASMDSVADELMRINNEHATTLRSLVRERSRALADRAAYSDMTELNNENTRLQRELDDRNRALERTAAAKNELIGMVAHDLRNPLLVIRAYADLLGESERLDAHDRSNLREIDEAIELMVRILDNSLDASSIEAGTLRIEAARASIDSIIDRAVALQRPIARRSDVDIAIVGKADAAIAVDEARLLQTLGNLLSNAIHHSPRGSRIRVEATRDDAEVCVAVVDEGKGVPHGERDRIFDAFRRGSEVGAGGHGLGLMIAKRIAEAHGGRLVLSDREAPGSRFELYLPIGR